MAIFSDIEHSNGRGEVTTELCKLFREIGNAKGEIAEDTTLATLVRVLEKALETDPAATVFILR